MYPKQNASSKQKHISWDLLHLLIRKQNLDLKLYVFLFSFEHFCAAVQTSMLIWKSNIIYSEGELTFLITHISEIPHVDKHCFSPYLDSLYKVLLYVTEFFLCLVWSDI